MHAVVTGAAGFIAGHLIAELTERGYRVTGIDRQAAPHLEISRHLMMDLADCTARSGLDDLMSTADVVFHLAARPGVRGEGARISSFRHRDNVMATANVLAATPERAHVVATSSSSVYGGASMVQGMLAPSRETDQLRPVGSYAQSKARMEELCRRHRERGSITIARPFTVAGEMQRADMAFAIWLGALQRNEPIVLFGAGDRSRDVTDVREVVEGLIRAAESRVDATVNLGTGVGQRLIDMASTLIEVAGLGGRIVHAPAVAEDVPNTLADTTRCESLLGFVPSTDLISVVERMVSSTLRPALAMS